MAADKKNSQSTGVSKEVNGQLSKTPCYLSVEDLHVDINKREVVRGVTFSIDPGAVLVVLGRNGAGKSTLLRGIAGLRTSRRGKVRLGDIELSGMPTHHRVACGLRVLPQAREVFPSLTVRENLALSKNTAGLPIDPGVISGMSFLGSSQKLDERAGNLSGGQKRLLGLEMVFCAEPSCLLLDEPTAGLDRSAVGDVLERISSVVKSGSIPTLLIEQNVSHALEIADRVLVLTQGTALELSPEEVRKNPRYYLFGISRF